MIDPADAIAALASLRDQGVITPDEFREKRAAILRRVAGETETNGPSTDVQPAVAAGLYQLEQLRLKLIVGRLAGIAVGMALWWFVLGPAFGGDFIPTAISLVVVLFGGLWIGQIVTLSLVSGRGR